MYIYLYICIHARACTLICKRSYLHINIYDERWNGKQNNLKAFKRLVKILIMTFNGDYDRCLAGANDDVVVAGQRRSSFVLS